MRIGIESRKTFCMVQARRRDLKPGSAPVKVKVVVPATSHSEELEALLYPAWQENLRIYKDAYSNSGVEAEGPELGE